MLLGMGAYSFCFEKKQLLQAVVIPDAPDSYDRGGRGDEVTFIDKGKGHFPENAIG